MKRRPTQSGLLGILGSVVLLAPGVARARQVVFDPVPLVADAIGLRMNTPLGSIITSELVNNRPTYHITTPEATWSMLLQPMTTAIGNPTPETLAVERIAAAAKKDPGTRVLINEAGTYGVAEGRKLFIRQQLNGGSDVIYGWLIIHSGGPAFIVLSVVTTADQYPRLQPMLDATLGSVEVRPAELVVAGAEARLERARAFVGTLTEDRLRSAVTAKHWYRIYLPAGKSLPADTEVGFFSLEAREGRRGELTPERDPNSYSVAEQEAGLLVTIEARAIMSAEGQKYLDVNGRYWLSWDRIQEAWSTRLTQRQGAASRTTAETGFRRHRVLTVIESNREQFSREPLEFPIPDRAYLSQVEVFLLGSLLPRDGSIEGDLSFLYYDASPRRVQKRTDSWTADRESPGQWVLRTQSGIETGVVKQRFDIDGSRLERLDTDGKVTTPVEPEELRAIWRRQGLKTR